MVKGLGYAHLQIVTSKVQVPSFPLLSVARQVTVFGPLEYVMSVLSQVTEGFDPSLSSAVGIPKETKAGFSKVMSSGQKTSGSSLSENRIVPIVPGGNIVERSLLTDKMGG